MKKEQQELYRRGYAEGYRDGMMDALDGKKPPDADDEVSRLPVKAADLSARARNCLLGAGCTYMGDAAALSGKAVLTMRNLGEKTASEIARWLANHGICYSAWCKYL